MGTCDPNSENFQDLYLYSTKLDKQPEWLRAKVWTTSVETKRYLTGANGATHVLMPAYCIAGVVLAIQLRG